MSIIIQNILQQRVKWDDQGRMVELWEETRIKKTRGKEGRWEKTAKQGGSMITTKS